MKVIELLASYLESVRYHAEYGNDTEVENYSNAVYKLEKRLPQESRFETTVLIDESSKDRVILKCSYEPLHPNGYFMDEIVFKAIITPSFNMHYGFDVAIFYMPGQREVLSHSNKVCGNLTDFFEDTYYSALNERV